MWVQPKFLAAHFLHLSPLGLQPTSFNIENLGGRKQGVLGVFFSGAENRRAGHFFSGAENRRVVGVFFGAEKICSSKAVICVIQ